MTGGGTLDLIVVGAGPAGLSCALEAQRRGLSVRVLEKGAVVDSLRRFPLGMVFFTTRERLEIGSVPFAIPSAKPTRSEALAYYRIVVEREGLDVRTHRRVTAIARGDGGFVATAEDPFGRPETHRARFVTIATGAFDHARRLGVEGEDLPHVTHWYREAHEAAGLDVVVVGGANSAVEAALDLHRHGARVTLLVRDRSLSDSVKYWILPDLRRRVAEGSIRAEFETRVERIEPDVVVARSRRGGEVRVPAAKVYLLTGYVPDYAWLRSLGVDLDPDTRAARLDPETFESNVRGLFLVGTVMTGEESGRIFIENGRFHGVRVAREIARRLRAAEAR